MYIVNYHLKGSIKESTSSMMCQCSTCWDWELLGQCFLNAKLHLQSEVMHFSTQSPLCTILFSIASAQMVQNRGKALITIFPLLFLS